ncbi:MAG TPA: hypothetical protein VMV74_08650, partial [Bacteroidales bacterium]|nr:hypothetical protein [Bacteroidales bacterium]
MNTKLFSDKPFKRLYYGASSLLLFVQEMLSPPKNRDHKQIPVIINNFNRLDSMKQLISAMEERGYKNIFIIDNLSTYPPLLEYFVYTDSDIIPLKEYPDDFMLVFMNALKKYRMARKVGFSLKIDDLPDCYAMKDQVIEWEKKFFERKRDALLFRASIDTTFALYRPRARRRPANFHAVMFRTAYPFMARHIPWYVDSLNPDEENRYYMEHSRVPTSWTSR